MKLPYDTMTASDRLNKPTKSDTVLAILVLVGLIIGSSILK